MNPILNFGLPNGFEAHHPENGFCLNSVCYTFTIRQLFEFQIKVFSTKPTLANHDSDQIKHSIPLDIFLHLASCLVWKMFQISY